MKPKVLLAGGTGYIGRYLSRVIEHDAQLFALSKYPKPDKGSTNKIILTNIYSLMSVQALRYIISMANNNVV